MVHYSQRPLYSNRQTSSANRNAVSCGTSQRGILLPVSEMPQCTGSKYHAAIQQITVCRSQRQGAIGGKIELRSTKLRIQIRQIRLFDRPDNVLRSVRQRCVLLSVGHIHLTDFNVATLLNDGKLATSLTGTKPYMGK